MKMRKESMDYEENGLPDQGSPFSFIDMIFSL